jgi:hypothetical protein
VSQLAIFDDRGQPTLQAARAARDHGMKMAIDHAEREVNGWGDLAYQFLENFCVSHETFISEDVSDASRKWGMVQPPTDRAWGSVYRKAARLGIIEKNGAGKSRRRHASICPRWRSLVYRGVA